MRFDTPGSTTDWTSAPAPPPLLDLHNHVLPGVDDGARSLDEALQALDAFADEGVHNLVATSHLYVPFADTASSLRRKMDRLWDAYGTLQRAAADGPGRCRLGFGQEIYAPEPADVQRALALPRAGLAGTRWMLVEFGFELQGRPEQVIDAVRAAGREILVAHPERYAFAAGTEPLDTLRRWRDAGAYLQVNLGSLLGCYRGWQDSATELGWRMLEAGLVHVLASDHHGPQRPQIVHRQVLRLLAERGGRAQAVQLMAENPRLIVRDQLPREVAALEGALMAG